MGDQPVLVRLRRNASGSQWGFRMQGGYDQGSCLYIHKVGPKSIAYKSGLRVGDGILRIGHTPAQYLNHQDAKMEIIRAGNELDLVVQRNVVDLGQGDQVDAPYTHEESGVEPESTAYRGYTNPNVQSRSFKILQQSLSYSECPKGTNVPQSPPVFQSQAPSSVGHVYSLNELLPFVEL